jgi:hypothetical protein
MSARGLALLGAAALAVAPPAAQAAAPRVEAQVVMKDGIVHGPDDVRARGARVRSSGRRCRTPQASPLAVLAALDRAGAPRFRTRGECSALYVFAVGGDRERGQGGWVYKLNRRIPSAGAADPSVKVRAGDRVTWFWCRVALRCQRTLELSGVPATVAPGGQFTVTVRAYDDRGRGRPAAGATIGLGTEQITAGDDGRAVLTAPQQPGPLRVTATKKGLVPAFPEVVSVR